MSMMFVHPFLPNFDSYLFFQEIQLGKLERKIVWIGTIIFYEQEHYFWMGIIYTNSFGYSVDIFRRIKVS